MAGDKGVESAVKDRGHGVTKGAPCPDEVYLLNTANVHSRLSLILLDQSLAGRVVQRFRIPTRSLGCNRIVTRADFNDTRIARDSREQDFGSRGSRRR